MITSSVRRFAFVLALGTVSFSAIDSVRAQSVSQNGTASTASGVTGTDPVPPSCGCKNAVPPTSNATTSGTGVSAAAQALLVLLGLA